MPLPSVLDTEGSRPEPSRDLTALVTLGSTLVPNEAASKAEFSQSPYPGWSQPTRMDPIEQVIDVIPKFPPVEKPGPSPPAKRSLTGSIFGTALSRLSEYALGVGSNMSTLKSAIAQSFRAGSDANRSEHFATGLLESTSLARPTLSSLLRLPTNVDVSGTLTSSIEADATTAP